MRQDYSEYLRQSKWYWIGTQYADGNWLKPLKEHSYFFESAGENSFTVTTSCGKQTGKYELQQEGIAVEIDATIAEKCVEAKTEARFFDDLSQVINLDQEDNRMSFLISNDEGVMYFQKD